ncbi:hypothetical protein HKX48_008177 [Thoreauomyces humboldtii]|nr:hypothetical protein HKX48_008177 [Thoreauomyces humboldtii]
MSGLDHTPYSFAADAQASDVANIPDESLAFLSAYKNEPNLDSLRKALLPVWTESVGKFHVYRCIQTFSFLKPRVSEHPLYSSIVSECKKGGQVLELGCCYGTDVRKLIMDGVPAERIVASDLHSGYWDLGCKLFDDAERIKNVRTVFGDWAVAPTTTPPTIDFAAYLNRFTFTIASAVLHVFSKAQGEHFLANAANTLVSGGTFLGSCGGMKVEGPWTAPGTEGSDETRYLHSPESLSKLLTGLGFKDIVIRIVSPGSRIGTVGERNKLADAAPDRVYMLFQAVKI